MPWQSNTYHAAICDRCLHTLEDYDTGSTVLFSSTEARAALPRYDWHEVAGDAGPLLICDDCWDAIDPDGDDSLAAIKSAEVDRYEQDGPDLFGGEPS